MTTSKDAVSREDVLRWAALAGIRRPLSELDLTVLGDFAIFARAGLIPPGHIVVPCGDGK